MIKKNPILFLALLVVVHSLMSISTIFSQESPVYRIIDVDYELNGNRFFGGGTQKRQLMQNLRIRVGLEFVSLDDLESARELWEFNLNQERIFIGDNTVSYTLAGTQPDGAIGVVIAIAVTEGFNVIALPAVRFASDDGSKFSLRARHYNFLGTMEPLFWDISYGQDSSKRHTFETDINFTYIIAIANHNYWIRFTTGGGYQSNMKSDFTLFRLGLTFGSSWTFGTTQRPIWGWGFNVGQSGRILGEMAQNRGGEDSHYFTTSGGLNAWFNIVGLPGWVKDGWMRYNIGVDVSQSYKAGVTLKEDSRGTSLSLNNSLTFGAVEKLASNFRRGYMLTLYNNNSFNFYRLEKYGLMWDDAPSNRSGYRADLGADFVGYFSFLDQFSVNTRVGIEYKPWQREDTWFEVYEEWYQRVRGIRKAAMRGNMQVYWNLEFEAKVWMGRFNDLVDVHATLFLDGAMMHSGVTDSPKGGWQEPFMGMGAEVKVMPKFSRNFMIRASLGLNANRIFGFSPRGSMFELFLGSELHF